MPKQNLILFIVFSALILGGWWWWQFHWLEQPKPADDSIAKAKDTAKKDPKPEEKEKPKDEEKKQPEPKTEDKKVGPPPPVGADEIAKDLLLGNPKRPEYNYYILATVTTAA